MLTLNSNKSIPDRLLVFQICGPRSSCFSLTTTRSFLPVAPPVNSLNVIRVIVSPGPSHSPRADVVRHDIAIICELCSTNATFTTLEDYLSIEQLPHFSVRAEFSVPSGMKWILDSTDTELSYCLRFRNLFPSATDTRTMDGADLVAAKSHDFPPECSRIVAFCIQRLLRKVREGAAGLLWSEADASPRLFLWEFRRNESRYERHLRPPRKRCAFFRHRRGSLLTGRR